MIIEPVIVPLSYPLVHSAISNDSSPTVVTPLNCSTLADDTDPLTGIVTRSKKALLVDAGSGASINNVPTTASPDCVIRRVRVRVSRRKRAQSRKSYPPSQDWISC